MSQTARKRIFYIMVLLSFAAVTVFEFLTPMLSDDIAYMDDVSKAGSFLDLFVQEYEQYVGHTGRSISHIILRIFLFVGNKAIFNIVAGMVFVTMSLLVYLNVLDRKEYDIRVYGLVLTLLWFFDAAISDTVLWMDGACNYLFTGTIILGFMTVYRLGLLKDKDYKIPAAVGLFIWGVIAGWCNENTSGGMIAFVLIELFYNCFWKKGRKRPLKLWMIMGFLGNVAGFLMLVLAPGNFNRLGVTEEEHTGLMAIAARFLKITLNIKENYLVLVCAVAVILILLWYFISDKKDYHQKAWPVILFAFLFVITCYALIMVPTSEIRSYYGASVFLMIAIVNGLSLLSKTKEPVIEGGIASLLAIAMIVFVFSYLDDGAKLARIKREFDERDSYFAQMQQQEIQDIYAPMLRPQWDNRFTAAYRMDITEDDEYWINMFYSQHYNLGILIGVDRETWTEY